MIDVSLKFLATELNEYLYRRVNSSFGNVELGPIVDDKGAWIATKDTIRLTLFQIEQECHSRVQIPQQVMIDGRNVALPPPLAINLLVLFAANFSIYSEGLRMLSLLLTFFQSHPLFSPAENPALPTGVDRLALELVNHGPEQANQMWACLGAKHLPSVVYRVRMLFLQDQEPSGTGAPVREIHTRAGQR
jgi:hypothetical protein